VANFIFVFPLLFSLFFSNYVEPRKIQSSVTVIDTSVTYFFGESITFEARFESLEPISSVLVFFAPENSSDTEVHPSEIISENQIIFNYMILDKKHIRAFTRVNYWFVVILENGETYRTEDYSFPYEDNRFKWNSLENESFRVHWYDGDHQFGQAVLDTTENGLNQIQKYITLSALSKTEIYVYADSNKMRESLQLAGYQWIAGHADPELGVVLVSLTPGPEQRFEMERQIPHELAHIMLYQYVNEDYPFIPSWLSEGIASMAELYPNPDYEQNLLHAFNTNSLIPIKNLCNSFPNDAPSASIAYAEASSFVRYLYQQFGSDNLQKLILNFSNNPGCDNSTLGIYNKRLSQLENDWRRSTFNENPFINAFSRFIPWLGLFILAILGSTGSLFIISRKGKQTKP
jgi:hypothetical protein